MTKPISETEFGRQGCPADFIVTRFEDGGVTFALRQDGKLRAYPATLGQAIQLRDSLNRHIDELALQQTGSLAQRASDDPTQLASVEEVPTNRVDAPAGVLHLVWNPSKTECVGFYDKRDADETATGKWGAVCPTVGDAFRESYAEEDDSVLPQTTVTFYE